MNAVPRVTIGMPVFNREDYLEIALDSILKQSFTDFELILSDNASTDSTGDICKRYAAKDSRIKYVRNDENIGAAENFNQVFHMASGEYFKWAASDDICEVNVLQESVDILDQDESTVLAYPKEIAIDEKGEVIEGYMERYNPLIHLSDPNPIKRFRDMSCKWHACFMVFGLIRKSTLENTSLIASYIGSDRVLLGQLTLLGKLKSTESAVYFRRHDEQYCSLETDEERIAWFNPKMATLKQGTHFRYLIEYTKSLFFLPISYQEKTMGYLFLIEWVLRKRKALLREMLHTYKH